ncbi:MAG: nitroreductase [Parachlamydiales bacterium]|nr:nitroreductase [Parachlamydiales bacterium]
MDFLELLKNRRSVRSFENRKVPLQLLHAIIHEACFAPSAMNQQPWRFIIIQNTDLMKRISDENKKNMLLEIQNNPASLLKPYETIFKTNHFNIFYNASSLILICGKRHFSLHEDCSLAAAYLMFSATEKHLATCWIGFGVTIIDPELRAEIGLTDDLEIVAPIAIGYPTSIPECPKRSAPVILKELIS